MKKWLSKFWHRRILRHQLGPQVYLCSIPSPFAAEEPEHPVICDVFALTCQDCWWVQIDTSRPEIPVSA